MIVGIGVDVVGLERFAESLERTPNLKERLFTAAERGAALATLAGTFAAKEAVAKALGAPPGLEWHDVEIRRDDLGRPFLEVQGTVAHVALDKGIERWHLSISHDAGIATAMVVAEGES
ncbi:MAG TPA: holo-ACP synthase [Mycobacteriales bacterium]|nr:holo-ACP synthase [Mycobacteriales bacterium]